MENPNGAVAGNSQNIPEANVPRTRSTFPLSYHFFDTHRFGEYHPHYVADGVKGDVLPIRSSHNVMSYTLKSPLLQNISMKKDYFLVPDQAILPLNWDKYFENPVRGDDVLNDVGPTVENFWQKVGSLMIGLRTALLGILNDTSVTNEVALQSLLRYLILGEYFYSNGSLLASLGCHGAPYCRVVWNVDGLEKSFDALFDAFAILMESNLMSVGSYGFSFTVDGLTYTVGRSNMAYLPGQISFRHALSLMRDNPTFSINSVITSADLKTIFINEFNDWTITPIQAQVPCRLERLWAYQLVVAHYYSNDHVDFIYSAELYRQLVGHYVSLPTAQVFVNNKFTYNGVQYMYDYLSAHWCSTFLSYASQSAYTANVLKLVGNGAVNGVLGYFSALFAFRRSLRYLDYFTGSRAHPLAVGSTGVSVVNNMVDVVDVTRNIQRQRFLNAVNRVRHNTEGYLKGIFGGDTPAPDYHNPFFLAHTDDTVYGQETENTGQAQMSDQIAITTNLRSNGSRYMFEMHCDRPCVLIGITYYDIPRVYTKSTERSFFHVDRFDMFNPFEQFIGDQPLYLQELGINPGGAALVTMKNFGYSLRHMEFKQRFNQAAGGFVENLPGFAFLSLDERGSQSTINPDWIRSVPSEFDNFYVSLTGYSNGSYFHFIVDNFNDCQGSRPMAYAPSIL